MEVVVTNRYNININKNKLLRFCTIGLFIAYMVVLFRIVLFKQVALNNLFAAIGSMERTISIIPFKSLFEMINNNISVPFQSLLTSGHINPKWRKLKGRHLLGAVF